MQKHYTTVTTRSAAETKKIASRIAKEIAEITSDHARVIALSGKLGAGKTTFTQGFARALGIAGPIQSPTFVLMKMYPLKRKRNLKHLIHIDAYRIETPHETEQLGLEELLGGKDIVMLIEWADRIKKIVPKDAVWIKFAYGENSNKRIIQVNMNNKKLENE